MLSREARKEARKRGSARRKIDLDGLVLRPSQPKSPRSPAKPRSPKTPKIRKSPRTPGSRTTPKRLASAELSSPGTPEISSFISPERERTPRELFETPKTRTSRRSTKTPQRTPKSATPKRTPQLAAKQRTPKSVGRAAKTAKKAGRPRKQAKQTAVAAEEPPAPSYYDYVDEQVIEATRKRVTQKHREKTAERREHTAQVQESVQDKRRRSGNYIEIKYGRLPRNKTKLVTLDVIKQVLVDHLGSSDAPEQAVGVQRKKLEQFLRSYADQIDAHFSRLIDTYLTNNLILTELGELNKLKNEKRSRIYEIRQQRREVAVKLNSLRRKYLEKTENHRRKMKIYKQLSSLEEGGDNASFAMTRLGRLQPIIDPQFGVVDKLQLLNELLREIQ
ncbi:hypothetical protein OGAPHI_001852 [Ogataea philodendri]|uniref:Inner kinetochore subunit AME1 domain-containing protein n=1 Tax=Ogataea philodendri TaxID=1378263 RepID=A0A9P8P9J9_9ASCO|nr:uncharacterized protein OGAPHI_001852 [Ogataea philodendri]KAH3668098.1 hypothetical protein OGAPHI_001852 [Ogataea philodendri]